MPGFELFGDAERQQVNEVLQTGVLMRYNFDAARKNIWKAKELEQEISAKIGAKYVQLASSGTTALITAMNAAGIGAGDEIIMPTFTFVASFEAVLAVGAVPVLVDIDESLTLCPLAIEKSITPRTKAIMPVHMCGAMALMDEIMEIARKHIIMVLEDACQAIGATYKGKYVGTIGAMGCYSFDYVKTVTCGEGGAVFTNDENYYLKTDQFTDHGHDHIGNDRGAENHPFLGLNYRISELNAAVGLAQWRRLDEFLQLQRKNHTILKNELAKIEGLQFRKVPDERGDNCSHLSLIFATEDQARNFATECKSQGIGGIFYWYDNNWHYIRKWNHLKDIKTMAPLFNEHKALLPDYENADYSKSDYIMSRTVSISISMIWDENKAQELAEKLATIIRNN